MNAIIITGRLTKDPELATTKSGLAACRFTIAVDTWRKEEDGKGALFIDCSALGHSAEYVAKYCRKGDMLGIQGKLDSYAWEDKDGNKRKTFYVSASAVETILRKNKDGVETTEKPMNAAPTQARENRMKREEAKPIEDLDDDDMPF